MLIWIIFGSFLVIVAFVVFSLFGFLRQSKVIDFAWGLSYTDSSLIGQVNELFKRELSVGLVKPTVVWNLREKFGINGKRGQWPVGLSRSVWFEIRFRSKLVWDFSKPFDFGRLDSPFAILSNSICNRGTFCFNSSTWFGLRGPILSLSTFSWGTKSFQ